VRADLMVISEGNIEAYLSINDVANLKGKTVFPYVKNSF